MKYLILALLVAAVSAQREYPEFDRPCTERSAIIRPQVKTAFNVAAYSGTWFEIGRYQQQNEPEADCMASHYSWNFRNNSFSIVRDGIDFNTTLLFNRVAHALLAFPEPALADRLGLMNVTYYADRGNLARSFRESQLVAKHLFLRGRRDQLLYTRHRLLPILLGMGLREFARQPFERIRLGHLENS